MAKKSAKQNIEKSIKKCRDPLSTATLNWLALPITKILVPTKITPNQITFISTVMGLVSGALFIFGGFTNRLIGSILIYLSMVVDATDGKVARLRGISSSFGGVFDEWCDRLREYALFLGITIGTYLENGKVATLIVGFIAFANFMFMHYSRVLINSKYKEVVREYTYKFKGINYYVGFSPITYFIIMFVMIFNFGYYFLWVYAVLGIALWLKKIMTAYKKFKNV